MSVLRNGVRPPGLTTIAPRRGAAEPLVIWRLTDGRRGHDAQSLGLVEALGRLRPAACHDIPAPALAPSLRFLLCATFPPGSRLPDPDLLIGAGHATHLPLLAARRARGGRVVVLMSPSLPRRSFDYCLIPEHDHPAADERTIVTRGPLNRIVTPENRAANGGLVLLGGPSRHYEWPEAALLEQVRAVVAGGGVDWSITDSPRTPAPTRKALHSLAGTRAEYVPHDTAGPEWLPARLSAAAMVWVSPDSMSMVYEALSSGAAVGVLELPPRRSGRLSDALDVLVAAAMVTPFAKWRAGASLMPPTQPLREADRCAAALLSRFNPH